jgi:hypothetical protein
VRIQLNPGHDGATAGQIAGILDAEEFTAEFAKAAGSFDPGLCDPSSPTLQSILNQVRQASDIMLDGTQDSTKVCNGISIGLGFTMKSAKLGDVANAVAPPMDPCMP